MAGGVLIAGALSAVGTVLQTVGTMKQAKAQKAAEKLRMRQMQLEADRQRREQIRRATVARAQATAGAYNQGAGDSSALAGGLSQVTSEANRNILSITQDEEIGRGIFRQNAKAASGGMLSALGGGISSLGGAIGSTSSTIARMYPRFA